MDVAASKLIIMWGDQFFYLYLIIRIVFPTRTNFLFSSVIDICHEWTCGQEMSQLNFIVAIVLTTL